MRWILPFFVACAPVTSPLDQRPPPGDLTLEVPALYPGHTAPLIALGAEPFEGLHYARGLDGVGAGPCVSLLGGQCLDLLQPAYMGRRVTNDGGRGLYPVTVPATAPVGAEVCFQVAAARGPGGADSELPAAVCGEVWPPESCLVGETSVEIGTGETQFASLVPGQDLEMVRGGQGGWHLPLAVRVLGTHNLVTIELDMFDIATGTSLSAGNPQRVSVNLTDVPGGTLCDGEMLDLIGFLDFAPMGGFGGDAWTVACGREVRVDVIVRAYGGLNLGPPLGAASIMVVPQPDPGDGPHCTP